MEIDLYKYLNAFSSLSAEQQKVEAERLATSNALANSPPANEPSPPAPTRAAAGPADSAARNEHSRVSVANTKPGGQVKPSGPLDYPRPLTPGKAVDMVNCPECGSKTDRHDLFCIACGSYLDETATQS